MAVRAAEGAEKQKRSPPFWHFTHPGDGQGLVEVFPTYHAEAPGGRTVQHHVEWHDPLTSPGRAVSCTEGKLKSPELWEGWRL